MMKKILYLIIIVTLASTRLSGQSRSSEVPAILENLFTRLTTNYVDNERVQISDSIRSIIDTYVVSDSVFNHRFKNLRYLGQITSPDSLVKIVTWNVVLGSGQSRYFCYFIRQEGKGMPNRVYRLSSPYKEPQIRTDTTYTENDWYGALYYDLRPFSKNNEKCWVILGIDYGNPFISRKIVDVFSFSSDGAIVFGKRWFNNGESTKYRDVLEYASNAMISLKFASDTSIVFDHLVPFSPQLKDDRQYYGPDYSSDAYYYRNGKWILAINIDARNKE